MQIVKMDLMDIEYSVRMKIFVPNMETFLFRTRTSSILRTTPEKNNFECEFVCSNCSFLVSATNCLQKENEGGDLYAGLYLKKVTEISLNRNAENVTEKDLKNFCKYLSELYACKVYLECCGEVYGNCNVFNGGSDYDVIEEEWFTCVYDKGELVEEKKFSK